MTKLKNSNYDQTKNCDKTQIVTKFKFWQDSNCDKTQKLKIWQLTLWQLNNSNCDKTQNSNRDKNQELKLWQNLNYDKSQFMKKKNWKGSFSKNILTPWQQMKCSLGSALRFSRCLLKTLCRLEMNLGSNSFHFWDKIDLHLTDEIDFYSQL